MQAPAIYFIVYQTFRNKLQTLSRNHIKLHICLKHPHYLNNPFTLPTHPKQQQQAEHQPKQQTFQKQKKALITMTMNTGYPGKKSAEMERKEQAREPQRCQQRKRISRKKQPPNLDNDH
jgi:uncharacterized protein YydD (DUF2326 family)